MGDSRHPIACFILLPVMALAWAGCSDSDGGPASPVEGAVYHLPGEPENELEDLNLPRADQCLAFQKPEVKRFIVNISRRGYFIAYRCNHGIVEDALKTIRELLAAEAGAAGRDVDGASRLDLLIRADGETEFRDVQHVMRICAEPDVGIRRIELGCTEVEGALNAGGRRGSRYAMPERKLDAHLPGDAGGEARASGLLERIEIRIEPDETGECGYLVRLEGREFRDPARLSGFFKALRVLAEKDAGISAVIVPCSGTRYGHVIQVLNDCRRAKVTDVAFAWRDG